jgi:hypothetical protein
MRPIIRRKPGFFRIDLKQFWKLSQSHLGFAGPGATSSWKLPNPQSPHDLQPEKSSSGSHEAAGGSPEGEAQGIPKQLSVLAGAGGRQIGRANANVLPAKGNAGEDHGAGGA